MNNFHYLYKLESTAKIIINISDFMISEITVEQTQTTLQQTWCKTTDGLRSQKKK